MIESDVETVLYKEKNATKTREALFYVEILYKKKIVYATRPCIESFSKDIADMFVKPWIVMVEKMPFEELPLHIHSGNLTVRNLCRIRLEHG